MKFKNEEVTFLGWLDNVWYHFKAQIIIGAFALVLVAVGITQCATREAHDVFIYSAGSKGLTAEAGHYFMNEMASEFAYDANGDGKKVVDIKIDKFTMSIDRDGNAGVYNSEKQVSEIAAFQLELGDGECVVYILQKEFFYPNLKYFEFLNSALGYLPENAIEGKGIRLGDLEAYYTTETLSFFPEDYIICLADRENRIDARYYEGNVQFFRNLIENTPVVD